MSELKTCLYDSHVALGAKMSPFAGFIMPIQYAGIVQEHLAVRQHVGMFDVSHMGEIFVEGPDAEAFVNHIFTNEIRGFEPGKVLYGMMCYENGGTVDDLLVYREFEKDHFLLVVNAANIDKDFDWIKEQVKGFNCTVLNESPVWGQIAVQGPEAEKTVMDVLGYKEAASLGFYTFCDVEYKGKRLILSRTGYTGEDGFELYTTIENTIEIWDRLLKAGVQPCGLAAVTPSVLRLAFRFTETNYHRKSAPSWRVSGCSASMKRTLLVRKPSLTRKPETLKRSLWVLKFLTRPFRVPVIP
jgi:aminomethyltransferase